jgi:hypothetical protein
VIKVYISKEMRYKMGILKYLLKNEPQDRTTQVVLCLICKTVSDTGQIGGKGQDKN